MKNLALLSPLFVLLIWACQPDGKEKEPIPIQVEVAPDGLLTEIDTARLTRVDSLVHIIDTTANNSGSGVTINHFYRSDEDRVQYFEKDGQLWRCIVTTEIDTLETRSVFYWREGKQQFIRLREWRKHPHPSPKSKEVLIFFEDGKIVAITERSKLLGGEPPSALYPVPHEITKRPVEAVVAEYAWYLVPALKAIETKKAADRDGGNNNQ